MTIPPQWPPPGPDSVDPRAFAMLVTGVSRPVVSRELCISVRLLEKWITAARRALGATTPYSLGLLVVRSGCVDPAVVAAHAQDRRDQPSWVLPTAEQHEAVQLLATGFTYVEAGEALRDSSRNVRRMVRTLARANGVDGLLPTGALFEALGWHEPPKAAPILE